MTDHDPCDCGTVQGENGGYLPHDPGDHPDCTGGDDTPDEEDAFLSDAPPLGSRTSLTYAGKFRGTFDTEDQALKFLMHCMTADGFYPNVWRVDDHGGHTLITL